MLTIECRQQTERRDSHRLNLRLACLLKERGDQENVLKLYTKDVSSGGAFLYFGQRLSVDVPVLIDLLLPAGGSHQALVNTQGRVIRCDRKGIAVRFDSPVELLQTR